jgi:hypothetical protein
MPETLGSAGSNGVNSEASTTPGSRARLRMPVVAAHASQCRAPGCRFVERVASLCYVILRRRYSAQRRPPRIGGRSAWRMSCRPGLRVGSRHLRKRYFSCVFVDGGGASDSAGWRYPRSARIRLCRDRESPLSAPTPTEPPSTRCSQMDPKRTAPSPRGGRQRRRKVPCQDWKIMTVALAPVHGRARDTSLLRQRPTNWWSDIGRGQALC